MRSALAVPSILFNRPAIAGVANTSENTSETSRSAVTKPVDADHRRSRRAPLARSDATTARSVAWCSATRWTSPTPRSHAVNQIAGSPCSTTS